MQASKPVLNQQQKGAALVIAMLILAIVVVITGTMTYEYNFQVRRVSNQLLKSQLSNALVSTESVAIKGLEFDTEQDKDDNKVIDHLQYSLQEGTEIWAMPVGPGEMGEAQFYAQLIDLAGRFNVNTLAQGHDSNKSAFPQTVSQLIFIRLLQTFTFNEGEQLSLSDATSITQAIVDYIDEDESTNSFECGEDDAYYGIEGRTAHRTANQHLFSVSELRLICNLPVEVYEQLRWHVTVWPRGASLKIASGSLSPININTASMNILRAMIINESDRQSFVDADNGVPQTIPEPLLPSDLSVFYIDRENPLAAPPSGDLAYLDRQLTSYEDFSSLEGDLNTDNLSLMPKNSQAGLASNYFLLITEALLGDMRMRLESVISREGGTIQVKARSTAGQCSFDNKYTCGL